MSTCCDDGWIVFPRDVENRLAGVKASEDSVLNATAATAASVRLIDFIGFRLGKIEKKIAMEILQLFCLKL